MVKEVFKLIENYPNYEVSNLGRVRNIKSGRILKHHLNKSDLNKGYCFVVLCKNGIRNYHYLHRLVCQAFLENPNRCPCVNHKDMNRLNNVVINLEWCTYQYNNTYNNKHLKIAKPILQFDLNNNFLKEWPSAMEAERKLGIYHGNICQCCKGRYKTSGGFIWRYKD